MFWDQSEFNNSFQHIKRAKTSVSIIYSTEWRLIRIWFDTEIICHIFRQLQIISINYQLPFCFWITIECKVCIDVPCFRFIYLRSVVITYNPISYKAARGSRWIVKLSRCCSTFITSPTIISTFGPGFTITGFRLVEEVTNKIDVTAGKGNEDIWHSKWSWLLTRPLYSNTNYRSTGLE